MAQPAARLGDAFTDGDIIAQGSGNVFVNGMPLARIGDATTGEKCFPPVVLIQGSGRVFANNIPVSRLGDKKAYHKCKKKKKHDGVVATGSGNVFIG